VKHSTTQQTWSSSYNWQWGWIQTRHIRHGCNGKVLEVRILLPSK